jgi:hypothetical protein
MRTRNKPSAFEAAIRGAVQSMSLGGADEITALAKSIGKGTDYEDELANEQDLYDTARKEHATASAIGSGIGGVIDVLPAVAALGKIAKASRLAKKAKATKLAEAIKDKDITDWLYGKGKYDTQLQKSNLGPVHLADLDDEGLDRIVNHKDITPLDKLRATIAKGRREGTYKHPAPIETLRTIPSIRNKALEGRLAAFRLTKRLQDEGKKTLPLKKFNYDRMFGDGPSKYDWLDDEIAQDW